MYKNALVGVDGRPSGRDAIALATRLVDPDGTVTLVHVRGGGMRLSETEAITPGFVTEEDDASQALLQRARVDCEREVELVSIAASSPGRGLHEQAEELHADLLVVGACSHGALGRAMLGDDTRAALNGAPCAVAVAAHGYAERSAPIARIGVGYDGSRESKEALALARGLAAPTTATVHALDVVSIQAYSFAGMMPMAMGAVVNDLLEDAVERVRALSDVDGRAVYGLVGEELAAFSAEVDILIVGSRGYGPVRRLVLGSTSDYLARHARSSLLVPPRGLRPDEELSSSKDTVTLGAVKVTA